MSEVEEPTIPEEPQETNNTQSISATILFMLSLLLINELSISYLNKIKNKYPKLAFLQATTLTTTVGIVAGLLLNLTDIISITGVMKEGFSSFFLIVLLPPILYESAINMERELFYKNFGSILIFAIFGTFISSICTAGLMYGVSAVLGMTMYLNFTACFAFGSLISATDPVAVLSIFKEVGVEGNLFSLIFGESILNDAVSIILFDTTAESLIKHDANIGMGILKFLTVFIGSIIIGLFIGGLCAYVLKHREKSKRRHKENQEQQHNRETTILFVVPYVSYLISEGLNMSGIVSIMFCGIAMARYALLNVGDSTQKLNKRLYHTLAYSCENLVFLFIGIGFVSFNLAWKEAGFWLIFLTCLIIYIARLINIGFISMILNRYRKKNKISKVHQFFVWFSGFRGAMAFALSLKAMEIFKLGHVGDIMLTITLVFAVSNIFINATALHPLIIKFEIQQKQELPQRFQDEQSHEIEEEQVTGCWNKIKKNAQVCDENCLKKILIRDKKQFSETQSEQGTVHNIEEIELSDTTNRNQIKQNLMSQQEQNQQENHNDTNYSQENISNNNNNKHNNNTNTNTNMIDSFDKKENHTIEAMNQNQEKEDNSEQQQQQQGEEQQQQDKIQFNSEQGQIQQDEIQKQDFENFNDDDQNNQNQQNQSEQIQNNNNNDDGKEQQQQQQQDNDIEQEPM